MTGRITLAERFREYEVLADSVTDFLDKYYRPDRYRGRGAEYAAALLASYEREMAADGWTFISHHDNVTGEIVSYYGNADDTDVDAMRAEIEALRAQLANREPAAAETLVA
jgi:hypothetical protein